jgi:phosphatidylglycerol---prolipoprotein diacylglyceryl transferase
MNIYSIIVFTTSLTFVYLLNKTTKHLFNKDFFWRLVFFTTIFAILGAKIFHVIENYLFYSSSPESIFSPSGYSILGAITFGYLTIFIFSIIYKTKFLNITDKVFLFLPLFQSFGRIGNIFNNELLPFSYYEIGLNIISFVIILLASKVSKTPGTITYLFFLNYGLIRIFIEIIKGNYVGFLTVVSFVFFVYGFLRLLKINLKI